MSKTNFKSVNWQSYAGKPVGKLITEKCYEHTVNPALKPLLKEEQLYLDLR